MRKHLAVGLVVAGLCLIAVGFSGVARAATTGSVTVTFTLNTHQELTVSGGPIAFGNVEPDATTGPSSTVTVWVKSNTAYNLGYQPDAVFNRTGGGTMTIDHLAWTKVTGDGPVSGTFNNAGDSIVADPRGPAVAETPTSTPTRLRLNGLMTRALTAGASRTK